MSNFGLQWGQSSTKSDKSGAFLRSVSFRILKLTLKYPRFDRFRTKLNQLKGKSEICDQSKQGKQSVIFNNLLTYSSDSDKIATDM